MTVCVSPSVCSQRTLADRSQSHIHTKSKLTVIDQNSKCGTVIDGEQIKGGSKTLSGDEHILHLGRYQPALRYEETEKRGLWNRQRLISAVLGLNGNPSF